MGYFKRASTIGVRCCGWGLAVLLVPLIGAWSARAEETIKLDCGVNALYILLRLEGHPTTLTALESRLPARHPSGYSMAELSEAAATLGLGLEGVRFAKGDKALDRSAIVYLKDTKGGHFAVLRPVGTTGTMAQVIDPPHVPWITDYEQVFKMSPWTGRVLIPRDPWPVRHATPLLGVLALAFLSVAIYRIRRPVPRALLPFAPQS